jgi:hypothetical protein
LLGLFLAAGAGPLNLSKIEMAKNITINVCFKLKNFNFITGRISF